MHAANAPEILKPTSTKYIVFTLFAALMVNLLPWGGWLLSLRPDFVALALLYWSVREPRALGFGTAWLMGLLMDVADGVLLGQHALAYVLTFFAALTLHRRIQRFGLWEQALHILLLLLLLQSVMLLVRLMAGPPSWGMSYFLATFTGALSWPLVSRLMQLPQIAKSQLDTVKP
jgi:rod shape-determining protein MreD